MREVHGKVHKGDGEKMMRSGKGGRGEEGKEVGLVRETGDEVEGVRVREVEL